MLRCELWLQVSNYDEYILIKNTTKAALLDERKY